MSAAKLERNAFIGLVASVLLALAKLAAGVFGHSSALVADAVESLADSFGSLIVLHGLRLAAKPPDDDHPYGHGKAEAIAALAVGGLLIVAAGLIVFGAFREMLTPHRPPAAWTLAVLLLVIVVKEALFRLLRGGAIEFDSHAASADAWHQRSDAITSAAALVGVSIAICGPVLLDSPGLVLADEVAALVASGVIVRTALVMLGPPINELLDSAPHDLIVRVRRIAAADADVRLVERVRARKSGRRCYVDMHLHVDPALSVQVAHDLAGRVKARIRAEIPAIAEVLIHIEPTVSAGPDGMRDSRTIETLGASEYG